MIEKPFVFIFIGRSGSGKGTQVDLLSQYIQQKYGGEQYRLNMGGLYRNLFNSGTHVAKIAEDISMNQGKFQPDFLTSALFVEDAIHQIKKEQHILLDGYPRTIKQMETALELLAYADLPKPLVIDIEVSSEEVKKRMLLRGRGDDSEEKIQSRLEEYDKMVLPMIEWIKSQPSITYLQIDGMPTPEVIHEDIKKKLAI